MLILRALRPGRAGQLPRGLAASAGHRHPPAGWASAFGNPVPRAAGSASACNSEKLKGSPRLHLHPYLDCLGRLVASLPSFLLLQVRKPALRLELPGSGPRGRPPNSSHS